MNTDKIQKLVDNMEPEEAALALTGVLQNVFLLLEEETRLKLVSNLVGTPSDEKLASLVHL
jgi:hypothetical protein